MTFKEMGLASAGLAHEINDWAQKRPFIEYIYVFGSRVRGDHTKESDLDISIDPNCAGDNAADWVEWRCDPKFDGLQEILPGKLHLIKPDDDAIYYGIRKDNAQVIYQIGKVRCIYHTRPKSE